ncbi:hypothetical protein NLG97_g3492 [Lecanicillium saksenae]|uniref:Uncharacterized protein n=1 Tax=Lecanicillium saksenae TaxID=468837 RepID=A0ACC1R0L6_9HYPO|nr:hypothetical protein NLG97_g3492 [Lecanicillium saksenae]
MTTLPEGYHYFLAAATSTFFLNTFHSIRTSSLRGASGVEYPTPYATEARARENPQAFRFNCAQRAHANFTENLTPFLGSLLVAGLRYPTASAMLGAAWATGRTLYLVGYTSGAGPKGRRPGHVVAFFADVALKFMAAYSTYLAIAQ